MTFRALLTRKTDDGIRTDLTDLEPTDLMPGDVDVAVEWSTVNYKDALAVTGKGKIMRGFPLIGGIDLAGTVTASNHPELAVGDAVLANGHGLGQTHHGGFAELARVPGDWLLKLPEQMSPRDAMLIGTAGYTATLCVLALEHGGVLPGSGDVLVTGANGGVGSIAVALLAARGHRVVASTGRVQEADHLKALGASEIIDRATLSEPGRPFVTPRWAGAVDTVGSHTLANVLAATKYEGVVTCCGLAQGNDLPTTVLPFILRGVSLIGIESSEASQQRRLEAWAALSSGLTPAALARIDAGQVGLGEVIETSEQVLAGHVRGRVVVDVRN